MKLAEALVLRADLQKRIAQLRNRLTQSALVQEGEMPPEDPQALLLELNQLFAQLETLIIRVNITNLQTPFSDHESLTHALARRDILSMRHSAISSLADTAANRIDCYGRSEIRKVATVDVAVLRKQIDEIAHQLRELDTAIQAKNWTTNLIE